MWIESTKNGKVRYYERIKLLNGKYKKISVLFDKDTRSNRKTATEILRLRELEESTVLDTSITFFESFDIIKEKHFKNIKPNTQVQYATTMKKIKRLCSDVPLNKVNANYILNILDDVAVSDVNYNAHLGCIKTFIKILYRLDYIQDISFLEKLQKKKQTVKEETKYLEQDEIDLILDELKDYPYYKNVIEFLVNTGLRFGELIALTFNDVEGNILSFPNLHGTYIIPSHFRKGLKKIVSKEFKIHSLRHTHASLCIDKGIPIEYISKRLGHEDTKVTQRIYIHKTKKSQKKEFDLFKDISF